MTKLPLWGYWLKIAWVVCFDEELNTPSTSTIHTLFAIAIILWCFSFVDVVFEWTNITFMWTCVLTHAFYSFLCSLYEFSITNWEVISEHALSCVHWWTTCERVRSQFTSFFRILNSIIHANQRDFDIDHMNFVTILCLPRFGYKRDLMHTRHKKSRKFFFGIEIHEQHN